MATVFIAGSIKIKRVDPRFAERVKNIVSEGFEVVVGDAAGADTSIQTQLNLLSAENVTVYCSGDAPRNNVGNWSVKSVSSNAAPGSREFFSAKDKAMARDADYGLMLWDTASTGTLNNVLELVGSGKKCVVFVNKEKTFVNVKEPKDMQTLVAYMSTSAKQKADKKIRLNTKISQLLHPQLGFHI